MPNPRLAPGEPGKFSEPKWNEDRGVWQQSCLIGEPMGKPSRVWGQGKSQRLAEKALQKRIKDWKPRAASLGTYGDNPTVLEIVRAWLVKYEKNPKKRPQNARMYRNEIEPPQNPNHPRAKKGKIIIATSDLGKMRAKEVRPMHIRLHLEQIAEFGTKQSLHKTLLSEAFTMFLEDGGRDDNPVASIKGYRGENATSKNRKKGTPKNPYFPDLPMPFTPDDMELYLKLEKFHFATRPTRDRRYIDYRQITYDIAGRPGEAVALYFDDIDFDECTITVSGTIIDTQLRAWQVRQVIEDYDLPDDEILVKKGWEELPDDTVLCTQFRQPFTKTALSMRTIKATPEGMAVLRRRKLAARPGQRLVFLSRTGKILPSDQMTLVWRSIVKDTPLEGWTSPKTLRSTRATRVKEKYGMPAARLILGHEEDSPVTAEHYVPDERPVVDFVDAV